MEKVSKSLSPNRNYCRTIARVQQGWPATDHHRAGWAAGNEKPAAVSRAGSCDIL
jgi:hypothetical protein